MKKYSEKLKHPLWQKKRLEIMNRDGWMCRLCGDTESTLNVHHIAYMENTPPWDYPDENLITLCGKCHKLQHLEIKITEDGGLIPVQEFLSNCPDFRKYFSEIGNHKGDWTMKLRDGVDILSAIPALILLQKEAYFDTGFLVEGYGSLERLDWKK